MTHHKRKRPKSRRAGCLLCKPHKKNGAKGGFKAQTFQEQKSRLGFEEVLEEFTEKIASAYRIPKEILDEIPPKPKND